MAKKAFFQCLICGKKFHTDDKLWLTYNKELRIAIDPNKVQSKIKCTNCGSDKVKHFIKPSFNLHIRVFNNIKNAISSVTSVIGTFFAELLIRVQAQWSVNFDTAFENVIIFFALLFAVKQTATYLQIDILHSIIFISTFFLLRKIIKAKGN